MRAEGMKTAWCNLYESQVYDCSQITRLYSLRGNKHPSHVPVSSPPPTLPCNIIHNRRTPEFVINWCSILQFKLSIVFLREPSIKTFCCVLYSQDIPVRMKMKLEWDNNKRDLLVYSLHRRINRPTITFLGSHDECVLAAWYERMHWD